MTERADSVTIQPGFPEAEREAVATLYWDAFGAKLARVLGPEARALQFLSPHLDPTHAISATDVAGKVLGIAGFKTAEGGFTGGTLSEMAQIYGWPGTLWRVPLLSLLERGLEPGLLLMDGIAVRSEARGLGLGSRLLDEIQAEAARRGLHAVRLDVIDSNPRARALYERKGFTAISTERIGPLKWLFGFSSATRMERPV